MALGSGDLQPKTNGIFNVLICVRVDPFAETLMIKVLLDRAVSADRTDFEAME